MAMSIGSLFGKPEGEVDPYAGSGKKEAMMGGAAMGSMFGPIGAFAGGALGAVFGGSSSGQRMRAKRKATKQSYAFGKDAYSYLGKGREEVEGVFQSKMSTARARISASGTTLEGSQAWESARGGLMRERDEALKGFAEEEKEFRESESYKWMEEDRKYLTDVVSSTEKISGDRGSHEATTRMSIGQDDHGRSNERIFTKAQYKSLRTLKYSGSSNQKKGQVDAFNEYGKMLQPSMADWEKASFGTKEDKAAFEKQMGETVKAANKWYDNKLLQVKADEAAQQIWRSNQPRHEN